MSIGSEKNGNSAGQKSDGEETTETMTTVTQLESVEEQEPTEEDLEFERELIMFEQRLQDTSMFTMIKN